MRRSRSTPLRVAFALALAAGVLAIPLRDTGARRATRREVARLVKEAATADAAGRERALATLSAMGDAAAWKLFAHLDEGSARERDAAAAALGRIGGGVVARSAERRYRHLQSRPSADNAPQRRRLLLVYARSAGQAAVQLVVSALDDGHLRKTAEEELQRMGPRAARDLVIAASQHDTSVQAAAIRVLVTMPEAAAPLVVPLFQRDSDEASRFAGMLLAELRDPSIVPELVRLVRERAAHDESDVLRALALYEDRPLARDAIAEALASPFPYLRYAALQVIRGWRDADGVARVRGPLLAIARDDDSEDVQEGAIRSVLALWLQEAVPDLVALVRSEEAKPGARAAAAEVLGFLAPHETALPLVRVLETRPAIELQESLRRGLRRLTYRPEDSTWDTFRQPPPARAALGEPLALVPVPKLPELALPAWTIGDRGPVVVVIGGLPTFDHRTLAPWLGPLAERCRIVAVDLCLPGSDSSASRGWEQAFDRALSALLDHLGPRSVSVVGHGHGALLALRYATRYPTRVERLALVGMPVPYAGAWAEWTTAMMRRLPRAVMSDLQVLRSGWRGSPPVAAERGLWPVIVPALFYEPASAVLLRDLDSPPRLGRAILDALGPFDLRPDLRGLTVPMLTIIGAADPLPEEQRAYYRARHEETGGRQRFVEIPDAGHFPFLERPVAFREELMRWLPCAAQENRP